jgi:hypothetical protein
MFGSNWLNGVYKSTKAKIRVGVCALVWVIWNCENNLVSNNIGTARLLQVIFFFLRNYRLSIWLLIELTSGLIFFRRRGERIWYLDGDDCTWAIYNHGG